jgi:phage terminase large subunit-like protein
LDASSAAGKLSEDLIEFSQDELAAILAEWPLWARDDQLPPETTASGECWRVWLVMGGRGVDAAVSVRMVRATRGKWLRAEPIAALYAEGRVAHVGTFAALEDQMWRSARTAASREQPRPARCARVGVDGPDDRRLRPRRRTHALSRQH